MKAERKNSVDDNANGVYLLLRGINYTHARTHITSEHTFQ